MKHLRAMLFIVWGAIPGLLWAQEHPVVVELYTSQGCSSCPPADAILNELSEREDVIALALHVDYWDYIGWEDPFGDPAHAERQRAYAAAGNRRSIYTPEMIVNGSIDIVGAKPMKLSKAIADEASKPAKAALRLSRDGDELLIRGEKLVPFSGPLTVHMLRYTPQKETQIQRGENAGHTFTYSNIVEGWRVLGDWDGAAPLDLTAPLSGDKPVVVILQEPNGGAILAAARLR